MNYKFKYLCIYKGRPNIFLIFHFFVLNSFSLFSDFFFFSFCQNGTAWGNMMFIIIIFHFLTVVFLDADYLKNLEF